MATKTERILDLLPATFRAAPAASPLGTLAATYGGELQRAENAMAAVMRAHWCDHADLGAERIDDLARFAALYGLGPHPDDGIEEFRRRLKLWVRLLLDGPSTVRGLLRSTSVILGIEIDDSDAAFDPWWRRDGPVLTTTRANLRDAAPVILGFTEMAAEGRAALPARLAGPPLDPQVDLGAGAKLRLGLDGGAITEIDLSAAPPATDPESIAQRINDGLGMMIASVDGASLILTSPVSGGSSAIAIADGDGDAAPALLGLPPRLFAGHDAAAARFRSPVDLSAGADLGERRYLRLLVDGTILAEIDCAGATPGTTNLDEIRDAINGGLGTAVASHDGTYLTLTSPTTGLASSIAFRAPAAQDATAILFGPAPTVIVGTDAAAGSVTGTTDLSRGTDLSAGSLLMLDIDGGGTVEIDCAGADPARSQLPEIVTAINAAAGAGTARHNGRNLILAGAVTGPAGRLAVGEAAAGDASAALLGLASRRITGSDPVTARIEGRIDLSEPRDLTVRSLLRLSTDFRPARTIDLAALADMSAADGTSIAAALALAKGGPAALVEDGRLILESPTAGSGGRIAVEPVTEVASRRFVSRVPIAEEAALTLLGTPSASAVGTPATPARITGTVDLRRGADLRGGRFLRIAVDGGEGVDIDCAGPRPRTTTAAEILERIEAALGPGIATIASGRLTLASPATGAAGRIALEPPRAVDALDTLLGLAPLTVRGAAARPVSFAGTADLGAAVDLSGASRLSLAVDGAAAVEVDCAGPDPAATTLPQVVIAINVALGLNVASHDGRHLLLTSPTAGAASGLDILAPASGDATATLLGIAPGRHYHGADAVAAEVTGLRDLGGGADLSIARFLSVQVDTGPALDIDCAVGAADPAAATLDEVITAINAALGAGIARNEAGRLALRAPAPGASSRLTLAPTTGGDARATLLGSAPAEATGRPAEPATIAGRIDLTRGADLSNRSILRIAAGGAPADIDVAGTAPEATASDEIVAAINARFPDMAMLDPDGHLRLTATEGGGATLSVLPIRHFEVVEYPPERSEVTAGGLLHGDRMRAVNNGAADGTATVAIHAPLGADSPGLVNIATGWALRLDGALPPGGRVTFAADGDTVRAGIEGADHPVAPPRALALPLAPHLDWPADTARHMAADASGRRRISLTHPEGRDLISLVERRHGPGAPKVTLAPAAALPAAPTAKAAPGLHFGRLDRDGESAALFDDDGGRIAGVDLSGTGAPDRLFGQRVAVSGPLSGPGDTPTILAAALWQLLDLVIATPDTNETFAAIALGPPERLGPASAVARINSGPSPSTLVRAEVLSGTDALTVARGRSEWIFVDCLAARFDQARFNAAHFAGGRCIEQGIFDVSRFAENPPAETSPVFAPVAGGQPSDVTLAWAGHPAGAVEVNLPADLPPRYGARFNADRFALTADAPETVAGLVVEPSADPDHFANRLGEAGSGSALVTASSVATVPIGFTARTIPFARPVRLGGGRPDRPARLYLSEPGLTGFIELTSRLPGKDGDRISVVVCDAGPGLYDLRIAFEGARFENARVRVAGPALTGKAEDLLKPGPRGIGHLKAGGVRTRVTRDSTPDECPLPKETPDA